MTTEPVVADPVRTSNLVGGLGDRAARVGFWFVMNVSITNQQTLPTKTCYRLCNLRI